MVLTRRVAFDVPVIGSGQPDYAQPQPVATATELLLLKYPETEISANKYDDYAEFTLTTAQVEYIIGTNANATKAGSWTSGVLARSIAFYSTVDFLVRFNYPDAIQQLVPAQLLKTFTKRAERVFLSANSGSGNIKMWVEG